MTEFACIWRVDALFAKVLYDTIRRIAERDSLQALLAENGQNVVVGSLQQQRPKLQSSLIYNH